MKKLKSTLNEDIQLFTSIQKGDKKAFDLLFLKYYPRLSSYACQYVNFNNSEEIVQEIMIWLWENREVIKIESSPIPYLFRAVRNNCLRQKNRDELKNKILTILYNHANTPYDDPNFYIEEELIHKIEKSIMDLPENYRQAFEMNRFQDMTYKEIASHLNISSKTVDYWIQQALKILRIKLKDYMPLLIGLLT